MTNKPDPKELTHFLNRDEPLYHHPAQGMPPDDEVKKDTKCKILRSAGSYTQILTEDGRQGYVATGSLTPLDGSKGKLAPDVFRGGRKPQLFVADLISAKEADGKGLFDGAAFETVAEIEIFEHRDFDGERWRTSLSFSWVGDHWNDRISSLIVYSGIWDFFEHRDFGGMRWRLGAGQYRYLQDIGIKNDEISSWRRVG